MNFLAYLKEALVICGASEAEDVRVIAYLLVVNVEDIYETFTAPEAETGTTSY